MMGDDGCTVDGTGLHHHATPGASSCCFILLGLATQKWQEGYCFRMASHVQGEKDKKKWKALQPYSVYNTDTEAMEAAGGLLQEWLERGHCVDENGKFLQCSCLNQLVKAPNKCPTINDIGRLMVHFSKKTIDEKRAKESLPSKED
jgi:uncharacterized protein YbcC (UPF0753/DUF2309 family)